MDVVRVVSMSTPNPSVVHLMDENGYALCHVALRFRLEGSRPFDDVSVCRTCVPWQNFYHRVKLHKR